MTEGLVILIAVSQVLVLIILALLYFKMQSFFSRETLTRDALAPMLRLETDHIRDFGDSQSRSLRQELGENLRGFQDSTLKAVAILSENVDGQVKAFGERLDAGINTIDQRVAAIAEKLNIDIARMAEEATANRETLRQLIEVKLDASATRHSEQAKELREELSTNFFRLGSNLNTALTELGNQQKEKLDGTTKALHEFREQNVKSQETLRVTVEGRLDVIRAESASKLEEMRKTVDEKLQTTLEARLGESFNRVVEQLTKVHEGLGEMKSLASNVGDLRNVLTNVKVRGTFGEVQAEILLEQFLMPDQYIKNANVRDGSQERVEFAIKLPGKNGGDDLLLPIDAKFPRETYERLIEASDTGDAAAIAMYRKELQTQIRRFAKDISDKYINPPKTTDLAILFLPTEGLFAEILRQPGLFESLQRDYRVILAGPTTLSAILNAYQMGFRSLTIEKKSSEVWKILGAVKNEFQKYNGIVDTLEKQLKSTLNSVDNLGRRSRVMTKALKDVETLPQAGPDVLSIEFDGDEEPENLNEETTSAPARQDDLLPTASV